MRRRQDTLNDLLIFLYKNYRKCRQRERRCGAGNFGPPSIHWGGGGGVMLEQVSLRRSFDDCKITDTASEPQILPRCILEGYGKTIF